MELVTLEEKATKKEEKLSMGSKSLGPKNPGICKLLPSKQQAQNLKKNINKSYLRCLYSLHIMNKLFLSF